MPRKVYIIHDLKHSTYYTGNGWSNYIRNAYPFYTADEARSALYTLKQISPQGNSGCIYEAHYI